MLVARLVTAAIAARRCASAAMFLLPTAWWAAAARRDRCSAPAGSGARSRATARAARWVFCGVILVSACAICDCRSRAGAAARRGGRAGGLRARAARSGCWSRRPGWRGAGTVRDAARPGGGRAGSCSCRRGSRSCACRPIPRAAAAASGHRLDRGHGGVSRRDGRGAGTSSRRAISPGKTWEGVAGAAAAVAVYYVVLSALASGAVVGGRMGRACWCSPACWR